MTATLPDHTPRYRVTELGRKVGGEMISELRKVAGVTRRRLADEAGVSTSYLGQVERGDRIASAEWLTDVTTALCEHMGRRQ